ncbi:hypothetical protein YQE_09300, partial [Dendroctonus ponderosae]
MVFGIFGHRFAQKTAFFYGSPVLTSRARAEPEQRQNTDRRSLCCRPVEPATCILQKQYDVDAESDAEDEMVTTERELAEDAQWKKIQQNTFTRWANEHLKTVSKHIGNLETDLSDGLRLISLIEVLANKRLPKHTKKPSFRSQKLENVSVALKFLQDDEGIRIVNIEAKLDFSILLLGISYVTKAIV